ncbi:MAG: hypothetical protein LBN24_02795, partial [Mediterranea sp.]|nr:hypothetical protein [Mediterranea sp.]
FGYIFVDNIKSREEACQIIAHELGHGLFTLRHTFDSFYGGVLKQGDTDNLMDYSDGTFLGKWQWDIIGAPAIWTSPFAADDKSEMNVSYHLALSPDGRFMDQFYQDGKQVTVRMVIAPHSFAVRKLRYKDEDYEWDASSSDFVSTSSDKHIAFKASNTKPDKVNIYRASGDPCEYNYALIPWQEGSDINGISAGGDTKWLRYPYSDRDIVCAMNATLANDRQECDVEDIERGYKELRDSLGVAGPQALAATVNRACLSSLRKLTYGEKERLFTAIAGQETIKEESELALLRLMQSLVSSEYQSFYRLLEKDGNRLLTHLVSEMDDASLFFWRDGENYTNFIGALAIMYQTSPESIAERWPTNDGDYLARIVNLEGMDWQEDRFSGMFSYRHMEGEYDGGKVTVYDVFSLSTPNPRPGTASTKSEKWTVIAKLDPLTPILVSVDRMQLPLVETALGEPITGGKYYVVPAIFLEYNQDKLENDRIKTAVNVSLDVATIAASGGTLLAAKVAWASRIWALAEVAGAVGDIGLNLTPPADANSALGKAINAYNLGMGIIGLKNVGKGIVHFAQTLPDATKQLLAKNQSLRNALASAYLKYRVEMTQLQNSDEWGRLSAVEQKQLLDKDEEMRLLAGVEKADEKPLVLPPTTSSETTKSVNQIIDAIKNKSAGLAKRKEEMKTFCESLDSNVLKVLMENNMDDFKNLLAEMAQTKNSFTGCSFILQNIVNKGTDFIKSIESYSAKILDDMNFMTDIKLKPARGHREGQMLEYKSWTKSSFDKYLHGDQAVEQMKAYIQYGDFMYIVDGEKLAKAFSTTKEIETFVRKKFQNVFKKHAEEFYSLNPAFFGKFKNADKTSVESLTEFEELVKDKSFIEQLSNIVKVE